jgi:hypothetical protein
VYSQQSINCRCRNQRPLTISAPDLHKLMNDPAGRCPYLLIVPNLWPINRDTDSPVPRSTPAPRRLINALRSRGATWRHQPLPFVLGYVFRTYRCQGRTAAPLLSLSLSLALVGCTVPSRPSQCRGGPTHASLHYEVAGCTHFVMVVGPIGYVFGVRATSH